MQNPILYWKDKNIHFYSISKIYFLQLYLTRNVKIILLDMQKSRRSVRFLDIPNELQMLCSQKDIPIAWYSLDIHLDASQRCWISTVILCECRTGLKLIQIARDRTLRATSLHDVSNDVIKLRMAEESTRNLWLLDRSVLWGFRWCSDLLPRNLDLKFSREQRPWISLLSFFFISSYFFFFSFFPWRDPFDGKNLVKHNCSLDNSIN